MSKVSNKPGQAAADTAAVMAAVPAPGPASAPQLEADLNVGKGGHYELVNGVRRLVERTSHGGLPSSVAAEERGNA